MFGLGLSEGFAKVDPGLLHRVGWRDRRALARIASEVTQVAEVGTQGILGGQAKVEA